MEPIISFNLLESKIISPCSAKSDIFGQGTFTALTPYLAAIATITSLIESVLHRMGLVMLLIWGVLVNFTP